MLAPRCPGRLSTDGSGNLTLEISPPVFPLTESPGRAYQRGRYSSFQIARSVFGGREARVSASPTTPEWVEECSWETLTTSPPLAQFYRARDTPSQSRLKLQGHPQVFKWTSADPAGRAASLLRLLALPLFR